MSKEEVARLYADAARLRRALKDYADLAPFDLNSPAETQRELRAILGERHYHKASVGSDACFLCGRDLRDRVHLRVDESAARHEPQAAE